MKKFTLIPFATLLLACQCLPTTNVAAHCDTLDGPVVAAAKLALLKGDVSPALRWVTKAGEKEIREAFTLTLKVRSLGNDARNLADTHFFETLVRVHRAGEGEPFTGLKPAGAIDPAFQAADKALRDGTVDELSTEIAESVRIGLRKRFAALLEKQKRADDSVEAGRVFVAAYVDYAHFVEAIHTISSKEDEKHHLHESNLHPRGF